MDTKVKFRTHSVSSFGRRVHLDGVFAPFHFQGTTRLLLVFADLNEQRRTAEFLNLLESAINAIDHGWMVTDPEGKILWVNPGFTTLTGFNAEEALGRTPRILRSGRQDRAFYADLWDTISAGRIWSGELENRRKDGLFYNQRMTIAPVRDEEAISAALPPA